MLLTLRGNTNNLTTGGIFTWTLTESYDVAEINLVSVIGIGKVQSGAVYSTFSQNPILYAQFTEGIKSSSYMNKHGGNQAGIFPIGLLTDFANRVSTNMLSHPLKIVDTISTLGTTIKIKISEIKNNSFWTDDIDDYYFLETDPVGNTTNSLGIDFVFDIQLLNHNGMTIND